MLNVALAAIGAAVFGVAMSVLKGNDGGAVRNAIGNLSAPWLALPFVAGAFAGAGRIIRSALIGLLVSFAALSGFYFANAEIVLQLGPHPWLVDLRLAFGVGYFFRFAAFSGPLFGALGGWWQQTRSRTLAVLVAGLFVLEPVGWLVSFGAQPAAYSGSAAVWAVEGLAGLAACALLARRSRPQDPPPA